MMDGNLFPVFILNHQFYILGSKGYSISQTWVPLFAPLGPAAFMLASVDISQKTTRALRIFPVDMETGAIGR